MIKLLHEMLLILPQIIGHVNPSTNYQGRLVAISRSCRNEKCHDLLSNFAIGHVDNLKEE
jgi:hypothetical protein